MGRRTLTSSQSTNERTGLDCETLNLIPEFPIFESNRSLVGGGGGDADKSNRVLEIEKPIAQ